MDAMPGTALSLSSMVLGLFQGQVGSLIHKWLDYKYKIKQLKSDTYLKDVQSARNVSNKRFQITRRVVFLMLVFTFCFLHIVPGYTGIPLNLFSTESNGFLLWPFTGETTTKAYSFRGFILTPTLCYLLGAICGLYCGRNDS